MGTNVFELASDFTTVNVTITKLFVWYKCILYFIAEEQLEYFKHSDLIEKKKKKTEWMI